MNQCKFLYKDYIQCDNKVMTKPDRTQPSEYLRCEPQSNEDSIDRFVCVYPSKPVSDFCFYHDRIMAKFMEPAEHNHKTHVNKLRLKQEVTKKFNIFTIVPLNLR